jgi:OmpA-OmpF porin, OOP family
LYVHQTNYFMRKIYSAWLACMLVSVLGYGQAQDYTRRPAIGVYFFLNDYTTATNIRSSSLGTVLQDKKFGKIKEMSPGLALTFMKGISNHLDYSVTAAGSFVDFALQNRPAEGTERFLLEVDASVTGKMFTDRNWFTPTVTLGVGASKYGSYFGAFIPAGVGLQLNFFDEAYLLVNSQYRIPVTETANYHFFHSLGIAGNIGKKKDETSRLKPLPGLPMAARQ